jgi:hypothetical protein
MSASDFLRRHGWQMRANHWEHPRFPDVLHHVQSALLQTGMWLEREEMTDAAKLVLKLAPDVAASFGQPRSAEREIDFMRAVNAMLRREESRPLSPLGPHEDPATCEHAWEPHLWEQGKSYCPHCTTVKP